MSRFRILFAFVALIATASALVACGDESSGGPQEVVNEATLKGIESGMLDFRLAVDVKGEKGGHLDVTLSGPFQREDEEELPELDMQAKAQGAIGGEKVDFEGGLTLLPNKAFVEYDGSEYEVDPTTFSFVKSALQKQTKRQEAAGEGASGCQDTVAELQLGDFIDDLSEGRTANVGGTSTTRVSGTLDAPGALEALSDVIEDPACSAQLSSAGPLPSGSQLEAAKRKVEEALKEARVVLYVGDDHIIRRINATATIEPPQRSARESGADSVALDFDLTFTGVNEEQAIVPPESAAPLSNLFLKLGINPLELAGALSGEGGLEDLLEGLSGGLGSSGGGSSSGGEGSSGGQEAYLNCIRDARTAADIQKCAGLLQ